VALFTDLHDVAQVLSEHIMEQLGFTDVQPGPLREVSATTSAAIRITYLYCTPQPTHQCRTPAKSAAVAASGKIVSSSIPAPPPTRANGAWRKTACWESGWAAMR